MPKQNSSDFTNALKADAMLSESTSKVYERWIVKASEGESVEGMRNRPKDSTVSFTKKRKCVCQETNRLKIEMEGVNA